MVKRIAACTLVLACLVSLLVLPASAADVDAAVQFSVRATYFNNQSVSRIVNLGDTPIDNKVQNFNVPGRPGAEANFSLVFDPQSVSYSVSGLSGSIGTYFSFYVTPGLSGERGNGVATPGTATFTYSNANGVVGEGNAVVETFSVPAVNTNFSFGGLVFKAETFAEELEPLSNITVYPDGSELVIPLSGSGAGTQEFVEIHVTSCRIISTASSADTEYLAGIADEIAAGNEQANAFYGDIMAILNEIYSKESEIEVTVDQIAGYILQALNELTSIGDNVASMYSLMSTYLHYLEAIAQDTESIDSTLTQFHTDFMTMFQTLISTVTSESDDIQAKMEEIYNMLIAYLNQQFGEAVPDGMDQDITDTSDVIDQTDQIESEWQDDMTSGWGDLDLQNYTLPTSLLAGVVWVSSWFTNIFNAYGADWSQILLVPALFGIVMLAIGMISRHSGGGRGGGGRGGGSGGSDSTSNTSDGSWHYTDHY